MLLITYKGDDETIYTLMVEEFRDRYNTSDGYECVYAVGDERIAIPESSILLEHKLPPYDLTRRIK